MKATSFLLLTCISISAFAGNQVVDLKKGAPAPYDGYLFNPEAEQQARLGVQSSDLYKERSQILQDENTLLDQRVQLWMKQADDNAAIAVKNSDNEWWKDALWFALGVAATVGAGYGIRAASK